jgi:sporulation protein YlmC with PRC-barrel domain
MNIQTAKQTISSADVNGTDVYSPSGDHLGKIDHLMIDKTSGSISYAVMGFGGFLGIGEGHHPIPWRALSYDPARGGYVTGITKEQLEGAPARPDGWEDDRAYAEDAYRYYGIAPYWL